VKRKDGSIINVHYCAYMGLVEGINVSFITVP
jgi:hypothetical protein